MQVTEELKQQQIRLLNIVEKIKSADTNEIGVNLLAKGMKEYIEDFASKGDKSKISDGYHTFEELYDHRNTLFIALCKSLMVNDPDHYENKIYKTRFDSENKYCGDGWFILGINFPKGKQISYHLPFKFWETCKQFQSFDKAPVFDGHTSKDVLERLLQIPTI